MTRQPHNPLVDKVVDGWIAAHRIMDDWTSASIPYRAECVAEYFRR